MKKLNYASGQKKDKEEDDEEDEEKDRVPLSMVDS